MFRLTWRSLMSHKGRLLLTSVAVILGTAFVSGTLVFTATIQRTFDSLLDAGMADVSIEPNATVTSWNNGAALVSFDQLLTVRSTEGVGTAIGDVLVDGVQVIGKDGAPIGLAQAPSFGWSWNPTPASGLTLQSGRPPHQQGEVALDTQTAKRGGFAVGDKVRIVTPAGAQSATVVGLMRYGSSGNLAGATMTAFDEQTGRALLLQNRPGYTSVGVTLVKGAEPDRVRDRIAAALNDPNVRVWTRAQAISAAQKSINQSLSFITGFLLVFAGIALLVGSLLVLNTFSVLVAQRSRDLAMLRALGATRRQVAASVLGESLVVGLIGGTVGVALGLLLAVGIQRAFGAIGFDMPYAGLTLTWTAVLWSYAVAVIVTLVAAWLPARRASRVRPVAALREATVSARRPLRRRTVIGGVGFALAVMVLVVAATRTPGSLTLVAAGGVLLLISGILVSPWLVSMTLAVLGRATRGRFATARLALENGRRNPRRTATTATALTIGLMLVSAFGVFGASSEKSSDRAIDRVLKADFVVSSTNGKLFSPDVAARTSATPGVRMVSALTRAPVLLNGEATSITGIDPNNVERVVALQFVQGSSSDITGSNLAVDDKMAAARHWAPGSSFKVTLPGATETMRIAAVYKGDLGATGLLADRHELERLGWPQQDATVLAILEPGADAAAVAAALTKTLAAYPNVAARDISQQKAAMRSQVRQLLAMVYGLLALAIVIALLGIVNTLALSIVERTREIGLLRAVGATRGQIRRMITWESLAIALFGSVLGAVLGLLVGVSFSRAMREQGISDVAVPWSTLLAVLLLACVMGLLAAALPARRAGRLDVLDAIAQTS